MVATETELYSPETKQTKKDAEETASRKLVEKIIIIVFCY